MKKSGWLNSIKRCWLVQIKFERRYSKAFPDSARQEILEDFDGYEIPNHLIE